MRYGKNGVRHMGEMGQSPNQAYEEMIGTYCRLDDAIRSVLPQLLRQMAKADADDGKLGI